MTIQSGSIVDSSGTIDFSTNKLETSGIGSFGNLNVVGISTINNTMIIKSGSIGDSSGKVR